MNTILKLFKSKVFKNIGLYTILNLFNAIIPFLLIPFFTKELSKEEYGIIDMFNTSSLILMPLVGLNIGASVIRFYYDKDINVRKLLSTSINFTFISSFVVIALFIFITFISDLWNIYILIALLALGYACFSQISEILLSYFRAIENPRAFGIFRISKTFTDFGISVFIILHIYSGWESRVFSAVMISFLFSLVTLIFLLRKELYSYSVFDKDLLKECLLYSSPLIIHSISGYLMSYGDRYLILKYFDIGQVGVYGVASQIGLLMAFVSNSLNQAWTPHMFKVLSSSNVVAIKKMLRLNYFFCLFFALMGVFIYLMIPFIYKYVINGNYVLDFKIVGVIVLGYCFNSFYKIFVNIMFYFKKSSLLSLYMLLCAILNFILAWYLLPILGLLGSAIASCSTFVIQFVLVYFQYVKLIKRIL